MIMSDKYVLAKDFEEAKSKNRSFSKLTDALEVLFNVIIHYPLAFNDYKVYHIQTTITEVSNENK